MNSRGTATDPPAGRWRPQSLVTSTGFAVATFGVSSFLLVTMGGAILAAPVTVPALVVIARTRVRWPRIAAIAVATVTIAEVAWAFTYVHVGDAKPWIWLAPLVCAAASTMVLRRQGPWRRSR